MHACQDHWIEAFVIKDGVCLGRSGRKFVKIGSTLLFTWQHAANIALRQYRHVLTFPVFGPGSKIAAYLIRLLKTCNTFGQL